MPQSSECASKVGLLPPSLFVPLFIPQSPLFQRSTRRNRPFLYLERAFEDFPVLLDDFFVLPFSLETFPPPHDFASLGFFRLPLLFSPSLFRSWILTFQTSYCFPFPFTFSDRMPSDSFFFKNLSVPSPFLFSFLLHVFFFFQFFVFRPSV